MKHTLLSAVLSILSLPLWGANNGQLFLRGVVHISYKVEVRMEKHGPVPVLVTNSPHKKSHPRFTVIKLTDDYLVSVIHP